MKIARKTRQHISLILITKVATVTVVIGASGSTFAKYRRTNAATTCVQTGNSEEPIYVGENGDYVMAYGEALRASHGTVVCDFPTDGYLRHTEVESVRAYGLNYSKETKNPPELRLCIRAYKDLDAVVCGEWVEYPDYGLGKTGVELLDTNILREEGRGSWFPSIVVRGLSTSTRIYGFRFSD